MMLAFFLNFIIIAFAYLCHNQTTQKAEIITVSFEGSKDGYAVIEEALVVTNYPNHTFHFY